MSRNSFNRLAGEDELEFFSGDDFFQPQDLSFVAQPAAPVAPAISEPPPVVPPAAAAPAPIFSPPKGVIFEGSPEALAARYEHTTEQGTQFIDPYAGLSTSQNLAGAAPVLGFTGEALYDPSRASYQGSLENYSPAYELTPEYKQFLSERGYQFGTWSKPGVNGQYFGVFDPTGKLVPGTEQFQSNEDRTWGIATGILGALAGNVAAAGLAAAGVPAGLAKAGTAYITSGGNEQAALGAGLGSLASPYIGEVAKSAGEAVGGDLLGKVVERGISGAGTSALGAAVRGGDIGEALLAGGLGGATGAATSGLVGELGLPEPVSRVATTALTSALLGKDTEKALTNAIIGEILRAGQTGDRPAGPSELSKTSFLDPAEILTEPVAPQPDVQTLIEQILGKEEPVSFTPAPDYLTQAVQQAPEPQALPEVFAPQVVKPLPPVEELVVESQPFVEDLPKAITPAEREKFLEANIEDPLDILLARPQEEIDWSAVYGTPSVIPGYRDPDGFDVLPTEIVAADQAGLLPQDFGTAPQSDINEVYNRIVDERGGFASTWQTVGSDRVQVQDDGSAIGINTETGETYGLDQEETQRMVDAGLLNTDTSGYGEAIRGAAPPPPPAPAPAPSPAPAPAPAPAPKPSSFDPALLMLLGALMTRQDKEEEEARLADVRGARSPFGSILGESGSQEDLLRILRG